MTPQEAVAQAIRINDGDHTKGAAELAEATIEALRTLAPSRLAALRLVSNFGIPMWFTAADCKRIVNAILGEESGDEW